MVAVVALALAGASLMAWVFLLLGRGFYWLVSPRLEPTDYPLRGQEGAPSVVAVIPARNEADVVPITLPMVLGQSYTGRLSVTLVDDRSEDGTAGVARAVAARAGADGRLVVLSGAMLPQGWSGKVWALDQGTRAAEESGQPPDYLWFTDADVSHEPWVLSSLVERAERERLDLVSVMALLRVDTWWDRLLIPAFVYFFAKLYPFRFVNDSRRRNAGAAGGCVLVRWTALQSAGGLAAMRSALIDDCSLGRLVKRSGGHIWLGFSSGVRSIRGYGSLASVWDMVARSAYDQLGYSPLLLVATVLGMAFLYALGPAACIGGAMAAALGMRDALLPMGLGAAAWTLMAASFVPLLRHHGVRSRLAPLLPLAAILYTTMTLSSAWRHVRGCGGAWKGRTYGEGSLTPPNP